MEYGDATIVELSATNIKRLHAVRIKPDATGLVIIGGENAAGKSSVLDSIAWALGGTRLCPQRPIRDGESKAEVRIDLGEIIVTRTFTQKGSYLKVANADGAVQESPQQLLDHLANILSFDPLHFLTRTANDQAESLRRLVGIDFSGLDAERGKAYAERRDLSRDLKQKDALYAECVVAPEGTPDKEVSVEALMTELRNAQSHNVVGREISEKTEFFHKHLKFAHDGKAAAEITLRNIQAEIKKVNERIETCATGLAKAEKALRDFDFTEEKPIEAAIASSDSINADVRAKNKRKELAASRAACAESVRETTSKIDDIDARKKAMLRAAAFPVKGLAFSSNGVTYNGIPFDQCSQAEQFRVSIAMGLAMNPKLKVMLIRDGSLLDKDNMKIIAEMAVAAKAQVWIERVGGDDPAAVIIEGGMVKGND